MDKNKIEYSKPVPPFVRYCSAIIPTMFDDSLSYYEALCALWKWLQDNLVDVINHNAAATEEYARLVNELKEYVEHYFDNLDVQEEINNKLDAMVEDGTLETIVKKYVDTNPLGVVEFKDIGSFEKLDSDSYNGYDHGYLQGLCYVDGKIVLALRSKYYYDNYVRLVEYDLSTNTIVREKYLELYHANALSYNEETGNIYVAACNTASDGTTTDNNTIFVVTYQNFEIIDTINVSNLPVGSRIRSVWYDNDNNKLYGGDVSTIFEINESSQTIVNTIQLDTTNLPSVTNQTLKKVGNKYYGVYTTYIAVWDSDCNLIRVINIPDIINGEATGEVEDIAFDEDGNIIMGTAVKESARVDNEKTTLFKTNFSQNTVNKSSYWTSVTTPLKITVNSNGVNDFEDGTSDYPYKSLQRAINKAMLSDKNTDITIQGGSYDYTYIQGVYGLTITISDDTTIDGLEFLNSKVQIWCSTHDLTIGGSSIRSSNVFFYASSSHNVTFTKNEHSGTTGYGYPLYIIGSEVGIQYGALTGDDSQDIVYVGHHSNVSFDTCSFDGYASHYAIFGTENSIITTYDITYGETISDSQANVSLEKGSRFFTRDMLNDKRNFVLASQGMKYPTASTVTPINKYYGKLCDIDLHYNYIIVKIKTVGGTVTHKEVMFERETIKDGIIESSWISGGGTRMGQIRLSVNDSLELSITDNRMTWRNANSSTDEYSTLSNNSPDTPANWIGVEKITFVAL